MVKIYTTLL